MYISKLTHKKYLLLVLFTMLAFFNINAQPFTSVTVTHSGCSALVAWAVDEQVNVASYGVERSSDGSNFIQIYSTNANVPNGNTNAPANYAYTDASPYSTTSSVLYKIICYLSSGGSFTSIIVNYSIGSGCANGTNPATGNLCSATPVMNGASSLLLCGSPQYFTVSSYTPQSNTWISTSPSIASVNASGMVTPLTAGTTTIQNNLLVCNKSVAKTITVCPCITATPTINFSFPANALGYNLTWSDAGATSYEVWVGDITNNPNTTGTVGGTPYNTNTTGAALIGVGTSEFSVNIIPGHLYRASVIGYNSCTIGPIGYYNFTIPPACNLAVPIINVIEPNNNNSIFVLCYSVTGATSYNVKFVGPTTILYNNQLTSLSSSGISFPVPNGTYQIYVQANCATGQSQWSNAVEGRPAISALQPVNATEPDGLTGFTIYPNPTSSSADILYTAKQNGTAEITVFDGLGATAIHQTIGIGAGENSSLLNLSQLANGIYIVKLIDGKNVYVQKLVVQK
jgi:hypothetical protein